MRADSLVCTYRRLWAGSGWVGGGCVMGECWELESGGYCAETATHKEDVLTFCQKHCCCVLAIAHVVNVHTGQQT